MLDNLGLDEQLIASTAVINYRRKGQVQANGTAAVSVIAPPAALNNQRHPKTTISAEALERVLIGGDLARLSPEDRVSYYRTVCESLSLNPLTKPFEYISLNGKLVLYARRDATDQLRFRDRISIKIVSRELIDDVYVVTAAARTPDGREDESTGAVPVAGLKGEAKANAYLKCETKAKRRVTLSICGLGLLDESEVETIPNALPAPQTPQEARQSAREAQQAVATRKIAELQAEAQRKPQEWAFPPAAQAWTTRGQMKEVFRNLRELVGEVEFAKELELAGVDNPAQFTRSQDAHKAYDRLVELAKKEVA